MRHHPLMQARLNAPGQAAPAAATTAAAAPTATATTGVLRLVVVCVDLDRNPAQELHDRGARQRSRRLARCGGPRWTSTASIASTEFASASASALTPTVAAVLAAATTMIALLPSFNEERKLASADTDIMGATVPVARELDAAAALVSLQSETHVHATPMRDSGDKYPSIVADSASRRATTFYKRSAPLAFAAPGRYNAPLDDFAQYAGRTRRGTLTRGNVATALLP